MSRKNNKNLSILLKLNTFIAPYKWRVAAALVALVATASLTLSVGYGVRILIDQGFAQQSLQELTNAIQFIVGVTLCI
ncbi:hypothetical protein OFO29_26300, partial [Escherichia coli]|nr:hypothetical protein [Escherichia coli]